MNAKRGVAVLALQGDFEAHRKALAEIGVESFEAKRPADLERADGLIIPGGESMRIGAMLGPERWSRMKILARAPVREFALGRQFRRRTTSSSMNRTATGGMH